MKVLTKRQILLLHRQLIEQTGGSDGIRDEGLRLRFKALTTRMLTHPCSRRPHGFASVWLKTIPLLMEISESALTPCWCFWR